jgi:hypothetical protein
MFEVRERPGIGQDSVIAFGDTAEDGDDRIHVGRHVPADRITTSLRVGTGPTAAVRRSGLPAGNANGDAMTCAWRFPNGLLDPQFDLPASREVVLIKERSVGRNPNCDSGTAAASSSKLGPPI